MTVKRIEMALHVMELAARHKIMVSYQSPDESEPRYWARRNPREIQIRPTKTPDTMYLPCMKLGIS